jgi:hypothetical protein
MNEIFTKHAPCGTSIDQLKRWMLGKSEQKNLKNCANLLSISYPNLNESFLRVASQEILSGENQAFLVYSVLLKLGRGNLLRHFVQAGILDRTL